MLLSWCWVRSSKPLCRASIVGQVGSIPMRLRFRCWAFCLVGAIRVCGLKGKNWSRFPVRPVDILLVLVRMGTFNDAGWSSPVAREAHNLEVVGSNPAPATWSSDKKSPTGAKSGDRGVFLFAGREIEPLIPRYSKGLRRSRAVSSLGGDVARDSTYSHAWAFLDPLLPQTLDRLSVSRGLG